MTNTNGSAVSVAALATAKRLPVDFLRGDVGLADLPGGAVRIPYFDPAGEETVAKRRTALKAKDGSRWPKGTPLRLYGEWKLELANREGFALLVEGESDCWAAWHHGVPALGVPGAGSAKVLTAEHVGSLTTVYVLREPDTGGENFVAGVAARLRAVGFAGKVYDLRMPDGLKDLADLHADDPDRFKERLREAIESSVPLNGGVAAKPATTPAAPAPDAPTGYDVILSYFWRTFDPTFRRGTSAYSAKLGREVKASEATWAPPKPLLDLLAEAADAPADKNGVKRRALPQFFNIWAKTAWMDVLLALPDEEKAEVVGGVAEEEFAAHLAGARRDGLRGRQADPARRASVAAGLVLDPVVQVLVPHGGGPQGRPSAGGGRQGGPLQAAAVPAPQRDDAQEVRRPLRRLRRRHE